MKIDWEYFVTFDYTKPLPKSIRTQEVINEYDNFQIYLKNNNKSINDYILDKFLKDNNFVIKPNNYPYNVDENTYHYVFWINPKFENYITSKIILDEINKLLVELNANEYICFENNIKARSVMGIKHLQLLIHKC
tara:strand:+ start:486 stop:890 length:405 start_codon:yes stop_codon:yes gene_type:complete